MSTGKETYDDPFWVVGQQVYNEFQWSDSDQSEIDFDLFVKPNDGSGKSSEPSSLSNAPSSAAQNKNKIRYLRIKSGDIAKKIRINISDINNSYLNRAKRLEKYQKFLRMINKVIVKGEGGDDAPVIVTPDESGLQGMTEEEKAKQRQTWQEDLAVLEEEIATLTKVKQDKIRQSQELKKKLGFTVWKEITEDLSNGVRSVKESNVYHNVEEKFSQLGRAVADAPIYQKTESMVKATAENTRTLLGGITGGFTQKIGQLKNSESFKSLEEKVGSAYENVKTKVSSRSSSMQNFDEALRDNSMINSPVTSPVIPEGKPMP